MEESETIESSMEIQAAIFAGTDKLTFLDIKQFKGNLFHLREQTEVYIKEHMRWRAELKGGPREEIPEIPVEAIREAVLNESMMNARRVTLYFTKDAFWKIRH